MIFGAFLVIALALPFVKAQETTTELPSTFITTSALEIPTTSSSIIEVLTSDSFEETLIPATTTFIPTTTASEVQTSIPEPISSTSIIDESSTTAPTGNLTNTGSVPEETNPVFIAEFEEEPELDFTAEESFQVTALELEQ